MPNLPVRDEAYYISMGYVIRGPLPAPIGGVLTREQRETITALTGCFASVRGGGDNDRTLKIIGPPESIREGEELAIWACTYKQVPETSASRTISWGNSFNERNKIKHIHTTKNETRCHQTTQTTTTQNQCMLLVWLFISCCFCSPSDLIPDLLF